MCISGLDTAWMLDLDQVAARACRANEADGAVGRGAYGCSGGGTEIGPRVRHDLFQHGVHAVWVVLGRHRRVFDRFAPTTFVRSLTALAVIPRSSCMMKIVDSEGFCLGVAGQHFERFNARVTREFAQHGDLLR